MLSAANVKAQVTIGSEQDPHSGAVLDLQSTSQGLKLPTVSLMGVTSFQLAGDPAEAIGMVVYNTNANIANGKGMGLYIWNGSGWKSVKSNYDCPSSIQDIDGNTYTTKLFGDQCWMTQNLRVTRTPDGTILDPLKLAPPYNENGIVDTGVDVSWDGSKATYSPGAAAGSGANYWENGYQYANQSWSAYAAKFGYMYTATNALLACPTGWHLATKTDFEQLIIFLNSFGDVPDQPGKKAKANAIQYTGGTSVFSWSGFAPAAANNSGWNGLPTGYMRENNDIWDWGARSYTYYAADDLQSISGTAKQTYNSTGFAMSSANAIQLYSIRCVMN